MCTCNPLAGYRCPEHRTVAVATHTTAPDGVAPSALSTLGTTDPASIPMEQIRAAYDALGLDPDGFRDTTLIVIDPGHVTVTWRRRNAEGRIYLVDGKLATTSTVVEVTL